MSVLNQIFPKHFWEQLDPLWVGLPYFLIFSDSKQFTHRIFYQSVSKKANNLDLYECFKSNFFKTFLGTTRPFMGWFAVFFNFFR
jgi:hypothetical protein